MKTATGERTILIVDDDIDFLEQQKLQLEAAGYEVLTAEGRHDAEKLLDERLPDLAIVDLMMEEMDAGLVLCHQFRKRDPSMPIILATNVTRETGLEFDAATGEERSWIKADVTLAKPLRSEQLLGEIDRLLLRR